MRVLVVDDDKMIRAAVRVMLEEDGVEVAEAADGVEALRALERQPADVILCDLFMPERDGIEMLRALRPRSSDVRIVAMSGGGFHDKVDLLQQAKFLGAAATLPKPFDRHGLRAAILRALEEGRP